MFHAENSAAKVAKNVKMKTCRLEDILAPFPISRAEIIGPVAFHSQWMVKQQALKTQNSKLKTTYAIPLLLSNFNNTPIIRLNPISDEPP